MKSIISCPWLNWIIVIAVREISEDLKIEDGQKSTTRLDRIGTGTVTVRQVRHRLIKVCAEFLHKSIFVSPRVYISTTSHS